jgi:hypothetical protein
VVDGVVKAFVVLQRQQQQEATVKRKSKRGAPIMILVKCSFEYRKV